MIQLEFERLPSLPLATGAKQKIKKQMGKKEYKRTPVRGIEPRAPRNWKFIPQNMRARNVGHYTIPDC